MRAGVAMLLFHFIGQSGKFYAEINAGSGAVLLLADQEVLNNFIEVY